MIKAQKLALSLLCLSLASPSWALGTTQTTAGWCSPAVNDTGGDVTINCQGLSEQDVNRLLMIIKESLQDFDSLQTIQQQTRMLANLLDQADEHKRSIVDLELTVKIQAERIQNILLDETITDDVKALIEKGELEAAEQLVDQNAKNLDALDKRLAARHYERGRVKELRIKYYQARTSFEKAAVLQPDNTFYLNASGSINHDLGNYQKAIDYFEQALASGLKTYGKDHQMVAIYRNNLSMAYQALGQYQKAINYFEQALASDLKTYGEDHPMVAIYRNNLGLAYKALGQYQKAIDYFEQALASYLKTYGEDHPTVVIYRNNLGVAYKALGQYEKAIGYYEQALTSGLKIYGEGHPDVARYRNNLGVAYKAMGQYEKAIGYYKQALASDLKTYGEDHPMVALYRNNLGGTYKALGQYQKAISYYEQALASDLKTYGEDHPEVAVRRNNLGSAWKSLGAYHKAIGYYEQALASFTRRLGKDHPYTTSVERSLAQVISKSSE